MNKGDVGRLLTVSSQDRTRKEIGLDWFTNRVVNDWNRLSHQVVTSQTIGSFKRRLDGFMDGDERWL